jgi:hypothetical protein
MSRSLLVLALIAVAPVARASEVQQALKRADEYRLAPGAMRVLTRVESFKASKLDKERQYLVFLDAGRRSLVLSRSPIEKGQKLLMLGDDFWIILPSSQRAIRITPAQKLLGDASIGDIATMSWAEDYDGVESGEADVGGVPCRRLDVKAQRRGVTYQRIELYVAKLDGEAGHLPGGGGRGPTPGDADDPGRSDRDGARDAHPLPGARAPVGP